MYKKFQRTLFRICMNALSKKNHISISKTDLHAWIVVTLLQPGQLRREERFQRAGSLRDEAVRPQLVGRGLSLALLGRAALSLLRGAAAIRGLGLGVGGGGGPLGGRPVKGKK